jgi:hypothetical protein
LRSCLSIYCLTFASLCCPTSAAYPTGSMIARLIERFTSFYR